VTNNCQQFYEHWRDGSTRPKFSDKFPYTLSLGMDSIGRSLMPFHPNATSGAQILITKAYDDIFHRILRFRAIDTGHNRGVVLTGQPGIGVSR
jgi:hypothetical protein